MRLEQSMPRPASRFAGFDRPRARLAAHRALAFTLVEVLVAMVVTVILMGMDRKSMRYIGAVDQDWRVVHSVALPSGGTTDSMLAAMRRF